MNADASTYKLPTNQPDRLADMVIDSLDVGMIVLDKSANITLTNEHVRQQIPSLCQAQHIGECLRPISPSSTWSTLIQTVRASSHSQLVECAMIETNQCIEKIISATCLPLRNPRRDSSGIVITIQNFQPVEDDATHQQELLQRLASLGKMTSRVAHELNNPLDGILRYTNLALRLVDDHNHKKLSSYLQESRTGIKRMVQIISDLLEYSRTTTNDFEISNINEIVEQAAKSVTELVNDKHKVITLELHQENMLHIRGSRLYQVCGNLMKNALDAMPDGGQLTVTTDLIDADMVIRFADTGLGLPKGVPDIFQPFVTTKAVGSGTGLGLAICKDYVEQMNGSIEAESNQPRGAIFTIKIPITSCLSTEEF